MGDRANSSPASQLALDSRRNLRKHLSRNKTIKLQIAKHECQHPLKDCRESNLQLRKPRSAPRNGECDRARKIVHLSPTFVGSSRTAAGSFVIANHRRVSVPLHPYRACAHKYWDRRRCFEAPRLATLSGTATSLLSIGHPSSSNALPWIERQLEKNKEFRSNRKPSKYARS